VEELLRTGRLEPRWTPAKIAAFAIAILVHLLTVSLLAAGAALILLSWINVAGIILGLALIGIGIMMRPRLGKLPTHGVVERHEAPELYALVDEIAAMIDTRSADVIAIDEKLNASWAIEGLRRRRVLTLGLPLLAMLEPQERVALIAHELAHGRNGDSTRGLAIGSALDALAEIHQVLVSGRGSMDWSKFAFVEWLTRPILWLLAQPVVGVLQLELHLLYRDKQRAEFLADAIAARAAGAPAEVGSQEKLLLDRVLESVVHQAMHGRTDDLFATLKSAVRSVPERELERRRRIARLEHTRLDATHPPPSHRIRLVEAQPLAAPLVVLDPTRAKVIEDELEGRRQQIAVELVEDYRASLYDG
jgi:Zn-dependent protease with chaperone function